MGQAAAFDKGKRACVALPRSALALRRDARRRARRHRAAAAPIHRRDRRRSHLPGHRARLHAAQPSDRPARRLRRRQAELRARAGQRADRPAGRRLRRRDFDPDVALRSQILAAFSRDAAPATIEIDFEPEGAAAGHCASPSRGGKIQRRDGGAPSASGGSELGIDVFAACGEAEMLMSATALVLSAISAPAAGDVTPASLAVRPPLDQSHRRALRLGAAAGPRRERPVGRRRHRELQHRDGADQQRRGPRARLRLRLIRRPRRGRPRCCSC